MMEDVTGFAVVEFLNDKNSSGRPIEVVCREWIYEDPITQTFICYWNPSQERSEKRLKAKIPDKTKWKKYIVNIICYTDTVEKAQVKLQKATLTSNVESSSEEDEPRGRRHSRPKRPYSSDSNDEVQPRTVQQDLDKRKKLPPQVPQLEKPVYHPRSINGKEKSKQNDFVLRRSPRSKQHAGTDSWTPKSSSRSLSFSPEGSQSRDYDLMMENDPCDTPTGTSSMTERTGQDNQSSILKSILLKVTAIQEEQKEMKRVLRGLSAGKCETEGLEEVLEEPLTTKEELQLFSDQLSADKSLQKKLFSTLRTFGGKDVGETVRMILRYIANNAVWARYCAQGHSKDKEDVRNLGGIWKPILAAVMKTHPTTKKVVEQEVGTVLREAPYKKGGPKYKTKKSETHERGADGTDLDFDG